MTKNQVFSYFGGNKSAVARAAEISRQAVGQWGDHVPPLTQIKLETVTKGKLKASPDCWNLVLRVGENFPSRKGKHAKAATTGVRRGNAPRSGHSTRRRSRK